jgi:flagellar hook-associated protein 1 FlgK
VTSIVSDLLSGGGTLGGVQSFRDEMLDTAQNTLGRTAIALADTFNAQHRLGQDLTGALGGDFFSAIDSTSPRTLSSSAATVDANVTDISALTASDYRLDFVGGNYTMIRLSDNAVVYGPNAAFPAGPIDGLSFTIAGAPAAGDSWLIQPTRTGARDIALAITDASRVAAAAPLRSAEATNGSGVPTNLGSGRISAGTVTNTTGLPLGGNITLTFDPDAGGVGVPGFVVAGGPASPILYNPATQSTGVSYTFPNHGGFTFTLSGVPQAGDSFVVSNNTGGTGDNRNGLALASLRDQGVLDGGTTGITTAYGQLVVNTGATTHRIDISRNAQQTLLNNVVAERESVSGVNLDEEAASMLRYQQAYQAAAQMIGVADTVFQTLLSAVRR